MFELEKRGENRQVKMGNGPWMTVDGARNRARAKGKKKGNHQRSALCFPLFFVPGTGIEPAHP